MGRDDNRAEQARGEKKAKTKQLAVWLKGPEHAPLNTSESECPTHSAITHYYVEVVEHESCIARDSQKHLLKATIHRTDDMTFVGSACRHTWEAAQLQTKQRGAQPTDGGIPTTDKSKILR